ncbi:DNA polymerase III subunit beta [Fusobacterium sp.]|uniref:DNA polymerase III subunit beta n=1 Tax=Fusobacterium sp. TaxID=68766 RepID=UPI001E0A86EC|nr:DNA polymerase III subunit beta [Fusobacterium sp.]MBS5789726.1 DNA polymerase III subunit beta [Fusobacterium sp.]
MIVRVKRQEFLKRLKIVEKVISENKIKPIISCTYLETKGDNLFFCGTNLETTITTETKVEEIIEEGRIVFQHQLVDEYLREIRDEEIVLSVRDNNLYIESSDSASEFSLMNPEDFPNIIENVESVKDKKNFKINSVELANILEKVKFAASTSSDNLSINCIRMENEGKKLKFATTDTYRLVFLEKELDEIKGNVEVSIPLNTAEALTKLLKNMEEVEIVVYSTEKQIYFKIAETLMVSRVIDLVFPNYKGILGNDAYNKTLIINNEVFLKVLRRIIIFVKNNAESKYGATFEIEGKLLKINGVNDIARINEQLEVEYEGEKIKISLNAKFISEFIQNLDKDSDIILNFISPNSSVRIRQEGENNYLYVVMPLALKD